MRMKFSHLDYVFRVIVHFHIVFNFWFVFDFIVEYTSFFYSQCVFEMKYCTYAYAHTNRNGSGFLAIRL